MLSDPLGIVAFSVAAALGFILGWWSTRPGKKD